MPLVADRVVRYSVVARLFGELCVNILDVSLNEAGEDRSDQIFVGAGDILNNWADHVMPNLTSAYQAQEVRWVDLTSVDGSAGSRSTTSEHVWPADGGAQGAPLPNNTAVRITKVAEGRARNQRNGRMFLGGILETATETTQGNTLTSAFQSDLADDLEAFKDGVNGTEPIGGVTKNLVVVHTVNGVWEATSEIAQFRVEPVVGTMRRRMPGYGD